ncbi:MAG: hypothetical protein AAB393_03950, partial [Bacteroidota bacterium]
LLGDLEATGRSLEIAENLINEKNLETLKSQLQYLRGVLLMSQNDLVPARRLLVSAVGALHDGGEAEKSMLWRSRVAECDYRMGDHESAARISREILQCAEESSSRQAVAEACYMLGLIAKASPSAVPEKSLTWFRNGFEAVAKEPVTELSWKLSFMLGREFYERGQRERAREFLTKAKLVLNYFLERFASLELKKRYLDAENKSKVLAAIETGLKT